jgi:hypothetical protein
MQRTERRLAQLEKTELPRPNGIALLAHLWGGLAGKHSHLKARSELRRKEEERNGK